MAEADEQLVTLWRYRDLPEALLAMAKLDFYGVWCALADDNIVRINWFWSDAVGGVRLQVARTDAEDALALLGEEIPEAFTADETGEPYQQPQCPRCHSRDITFEPRYRGHVVAFLGLAFVVGAAFVLLALYFSISKKRWKCADCGNEWAAEYD